MGMVDTFTIRLDAGQRRKLAQLAAQTDRTRASVIRRLIDLAVVAEPDLQVDPVSFPDRRRKWERRAEQILATDSLEPPF